MSMPNRDARRVRLAQLRSQRHRGLLVLPPSNVLDWEGLCQECGTETEGGKDLFCGNFGRFKEETGERNLVIVLANVTNGGLEIRKWIDLLTGLLKEEGREKEVGPALCNEDGNMLERWKLNGELHKALSKLRGSGRGGIPAGIDIDERFNVYRSFRRGATTRAKEQGVDETTIEMNNRWRKWQNKRGSMPNLPMSQLYVEISQVLASKLRFSQSL